MSDFEKLINASDLIEWIIETDPDWCVDSVRSIIDHIDKMPSKQPVLCKDCKWWRHNLCDYMSDEDIMNGLLVARADDYCSYAERREDE